MITNLQGIESFATCFPMTMTQLREEGGNKNRKGGLSVFPRNQSEGFFICPTFV